MRGEMKRVVVGLAAVVVCCTCAGAQPGGAKKPDAANPPTTAPETTKAPAAPVKAEFPKPVAKKLFAKNDFRGKKAPEFFVQKWVGKNAKEPDRKGKVVLIDFWATWCGPCRALIPEINEWHKQFKDDLVVMGVSDESAEVVEVFMGLRKPPEPKPGEPPAPARVSTVKIEYPMAIDTEEKMKGALGVAGIPHVMVIDSKGIVRWQGFPQSGEETLTADVLRQIIAADKAQRGGGKAEDKAKTPTPGEPKKAETPAGEPTKK